MTARVMLWAAVLAGAGGLAAVRGAGTDVMGAMAPPFPSTAPADWIGTPVTWQDLRGRVVLLDVWTFG